MASNLSSQDGDVGFQVASMIDVVFVLMLFFMACAGTAMRERELSVSVPSTGRPGPTPIVIAIAADGTVTMNDQQLGVSTDTELRALREWLRDARTRFGDADPVVIRPDATVRHDRLMNVLNAVSAVGVKKLSFS